MDGGKKNSFKIQSTNDIRKHAQDWNLAGDVGLLAHLERFSEDIFNKTQQTQQYFNELVENYEEVHTKIGNITNQFLALQNCQFVENRVYDEETPTEEKTETKVIDEVEQEKLLLMHYKKAVEVGVQLLDTHFQEVQLPPNSDSDEEDDEISTGNSLIWRPKNPYAGKKFPLLIGSAEWWADDNVGLGEAEENADTEMVISESDSDVEFNQVVEKRVQLSSSSSMDDEKSVPKKPKYLESSSEDLFGLEKNDDFRNSEPDFFAKGNNPLLGESHNFLSSPPEVHREEESGKEDNLFEENHNDEEMDNAVQEENLTKKPKKMDNAFTRELAAKLGAVGSKKEDVKEKTEKLPSKTEKLPPKTEKLPPKTEKLPVKTEKLPAVKPKEDLFTDDNLFDETDDSSDLFSGKTKNLSVGSRSLFFDAENDDQLFSGSNNLFFESDSSLIFDNETQKQSKELSLDKNNRDVPPPDKTFKKEEPILPKANLVKDLFEDIDHDDILFASKPLDKQINKSSSSLENNKSKKAESIASPKFIRGDSDVGKGLFDSSDNEFEDDSPKKIPFFDDGIGKGKDSKIQSSGDSINKNTKSSSEETSKVSSRESSVPRLQKDFDSQVKKLEDKSDTSIFGDSSSSTTSTPKINRSETNVSRARGSAERKIMEKEIVEDKDDLFSKSFKEDSPFERRTAPSTKIISALDDDDTSLFSDKPKQQDSLSISSSRSSLFDDVSTSKSRLASVFEKDKSSKVEDDLFNTSGDSIFGWESKTEGKDLFSAKPKTKAKEKDKSSLFDDCDDSDDLFGSVKQKEDIFTDKSLFDKSTDKPQEKVDDLFSKGKTDSGSSLKEIKEPDDLFGGESITKKSALPQNSLLHDLATEDDLFKDVFTDSRQKKKTDNLEKEKSSVKAEEAAATSKIETAAIDKTKDLFEDIFSDSKQEKKSEERVEEEKRAVKTEDKVGSTKIEPPVLNTKDLFEDIFTDSIQKEKTEKSDEEKSTVKSKEVVKAPKIESEVLDTEDLFQDVIGDSSRKKEDLPKKEKSVVKPAETAEIKTAVLDKPKPKEPERDLFSEKSSLPSKISSIQKIFTDTDDAELFTGKTKPQNDSTIAKPKPPSSLSLKKDSVSPEGDSKPKNIGKLNIPGNLKARLESITKVPSSEEVTAKPTATEEVVTKPIATEGVITKSVVSEEVKPQEEKPIGELPFETSSALLKCPSKDRVRIQVRRRPQSRRARQEAIRNSSGNLDFDVERPLFDKSFLKPSRTTSCINVSQKQTSEPVKDSPEPLFSPPLSNPLSPSTDEEDYFNVPELDKNFEKEDQSIFTSNLFQSASTSKIDDNLLFDGAPVLSPLSPKKGTNYPKQEPEKSKSDTLFPTCQTKPKVKSLSIFEDDDGGDDEDNLFGGEESLKKPKEKKDVNSGAESSSLFQSHRTKTFASDVTSTKSLFGTDLDDGDDLFGEKSTTAPASTKISTEKVSKTGDKNPIEKDKGNPSFVDPLGLMFSDE